jgi:TPP-dependent indolepyruvate ferredoxin oxidoreductase alpha subunit
LPQVNHKDENSRNNNVNNLEWCTAKYNCNYGNHIVKLRKRMTENNPSKGRHHTKEAIKKMRLKKLGKPSRRKRKIMIDGVEYESITEAMNKLNISTRKLYKILKDETKKGSDMR